jgi:hypothetical protein
MRDKLVAGYQVLPHESLTAAAEAGYADQSGLTFPAALMTERRLGVDVDHHPTHRPAGQDGVR